MRHGAHLPHPGSRWADCLVPYIAVAIAALQWKWVCITMERMQWWLSCDRHVAGGGLLGAVLCWTNVQKARRPVSPEPLTQNPQVASLPWRDVCGLWKDYTTAIADCLAAAAGDDSAAAGRRLTRLLFEAGGVSNGSCSSKVEVPDLSCLGGHAWAAVDTVSILSMHQMLPKTVVSLQGCCGMRCRSTGTGRGCRALRCASCRMQRVCRRHYRSSAGGRCRPRCC